MTIIFYDIPSTVPGSTWSPNTWKVRYALNYKGIAYKTEWVEYPDIESHCKARGIAATGKWSNGTPYFSLPAIYDSLTNQYVCDSFEIAQYLDKTYPDTPPIFPNDTIGLQEAFGSAFASNLSPLWPFILPAVRDKLNPVSAEYFTRTREQLVFGKKLEDVIPTGAAKEVEWTKYKDGLAKVNVWYDKSSDKGPFILGSTPSWADFYVASYTIWLRIIWGDDSEEWKDIASWNDGRWAKLIESLKPYDTII